MSSVIILFVIYLILFGVYCTSELLRLLSNNSARHTIFVLRRNFYYLQILPFLFLPTVSYLEIRIANLKPNQPDIEMKFMFYKIEVKIKSDTSLFHDRLIIYYSIFQQFPLLLYKKDVLVTNSQESRSVINMRSEGQLKYIQL